jgi:hypothetical protein
MKELSAKMKETSSTKFLGSEIRYDNRPNLFMVGVGYKF